MREASGWQLLESLAKTPVKCRVLDNSIYQGFFNLGLNTGISSYELTLRTESAIWAEAKAPGIEVVKKGAIFLHYCPFLATSIPGAFASAQMALSVRKVSLKDRKCRKFNAVANFSIRYL